MASTTKANIVRAAAERIRRQGPAATSFTEVLADAGAPRGVIYHHFPGGKDELVRDAVGLVGETVHRRLEAAPTSSPGAVLSHFIAMSREVAEAAVTGAGCAVAAVALEGQEHGHPLLDAVNDALSSWRTTLRRNLRAAGLGDAAAATLADLAIAGHEGALLLCRAQGDTRPFERMAAGLRAALEGLELREGARRARR